MLAFRIKIQLTWSSTRKAGLETASWRTFPQTKRSLRITQSNAFQFGSVGISDSWASLWSFINEAPRHGYSLLLVYEKSRRNTNVLALSLEWGHDIFYHQHPWKDRNEPIKPQLSWIVCFSTFSKMDCSKGRLYIYIYWTRVWRVLFEGSNIKSCTVVRCYCTISIITNFFEI